MSLVDLRDALERAEWSIGTSPKASATVHWPAAAERITDPLGALHGYAAYHASKDWSPEPGVQGADGIQYARAVDQQGNRYILRDLNAVLWHCDNATGNATSVPYLALVAIDETPTPALLNGLRAQLEEDGLVEVHPHGPDWTRTACPGPAMRAWVDDGMPTNEEEEMTPEEREREFIALTHQHITPTVDAIKEVLVDHAKILRAGGFHDDAQETHLRELELRMDRLRNALLQFSDPVA